MRKTVFLFVISIVLFVACEKNERPEGSYSFSAGYIKYEATLGEDLDSALDSLLTVIDYRPADTHIVATELVEVDYPDDDRLFYWVAFKDTNKRTYLQSPKDVLDTKGCWYKMFWEEN